MSFKFKKDRYQKIRGGNSKLLDIYCSRCNKHIAYYQKDGPGILKRMYLDRTINDQNINLNLKELICPSCKQILGVQIIYEKENRPAIRLFAGAVSKKIVKKIPTSFSEEK
ncbi:MAG TPA: hypothetical protein VG895_03635 [Patescibacteria group bacterium]|nr:hypothetical protein [Patescibacteria group bacterium]